MKYLLPIILAFAIVIQGEQVTVGGVSIGIPGGTLVIKKYTLVIDAKHVKILPMVKPAAAPTPSQGETNGTQNQ